MKRALLQLHLSVFLAGFTGILGKLITLNEGMLVWYRLLITVISMYILYRWKGLLKKLPWKAIVQIGGTGFIVALHWIFFYGSIKYANVSIGVVCLSLMSLFTAIFDPLITRRKFDRAEMLLSLLTVCGILLIFHFDTQYRTGIILGIFSAMFAALFTVLNKKLVVMYDAINITFYELGVGFLGLTLIMPLYLYAFPVASLLPSLSDLGYLLILSWFCTILMYMLMVHALRKISPFTVNLCFSLEPLYSIILAFILFRENDFLKGGFYAGLALILLSVALQMMRIYRQSRRGIAVS